MIAQSGLVEGQKFILKVKSREEIDDMLKQTGTIVFGWSNEMYEFCGKELQLSVYGFRHDGVMLKANGNSWTWGFHMLNHISKQKSILSNL